MRRQHARGIRVPILQARKERGGDVAPRRNNRMKEAATKESKEANMKYVECGWKKLNVRIKIHTYRCQHSVKYEHDDATYERMTLRAMLA